MTSIRLAAFLGFATPVYFLALILVFGWMTPGYTHASKAVSELGALGAPFALAWNVLGFCWTGALLAAFGAAFPGSPNTKWALFLAGVAFAATAIPADFENRQSGQTFAHWIASVAAFAAWIWALCSMFSHAPKGFRALSIVFLTLALISILLQASGLVWPGTGQRVTFGVFFGWYFAAGVLMVRLRPSAADSANS